MKVVDSGSSLKLGLNVDELLALLSEIYLPDFYSHQILPQFVACQGILGVVNMGEEDVLANHQRFGKDIRRVGYQRLLVFESLINYS